MGGMPRDSDAPAYRAATIADAEPIAALHADSWRRHYRGAYSDSYLDGDVLADRRAVWGERLAGDAPDRRTLVAERGGRVVGFAHVVLDADPSWGALLDNLHVAHDRRREGIGGALMARTARAVVEARPASALYLWVQEQNRPAQSFYGALGGRCVERVEIEPPGGDPSRLAPGTPMKLRYAWPSPAALLTR